MKALCLISHTVPLDDGRFKEYEAGRFYETDAAEGPLWKSTEKEPGPADEATPASKGGKSRKKKIPVAGEGMPF